MIRTAESATASSRHVRAGWQARLQLAFERRGASTVLAERQHQGPLVVQRPFYPEGEVCHVYVVHPPGGVVAGDELQLDVHLRPGAHALLTTPAAGKFYRSEGALAQLRQHFTLGGGALEWLPQESIFYPGAAVLLSTELRLDAAARFLGWELACLGLSASAAPFGSGALRQHLQVWRDEQLLLNERQVLDWEAIVARWGLDGQAALGTLLACPAGARELELARAAVEGHPAAACTLVDGLLICRAMGQNGAALRQAFVRIWSAVRPGLLGRAAQLPRVWAT